MDITLATHGSDRRPSARPSINRPEGKPSALPSALPSARPSALPSARPSAIPTVVSPKQKQNISKLQNDLKNIHGNSQVTQEQVKDLSGDLMTLAEGTVKPSQSSVDTLASDLANFTADANISRAESYKLMQDISAVMNSANIPRSEVQAVIDDVNTILAASGISQAEAQEIVSDLEAIATEIQSNVK